MLKKALIILTLSAAVTVPTVAAKAQGAPLSVPEKVPTFATTKIKNAGLGHDEEVWVMLGSPIPTGWVVIRYSFDGKSMLLKNLNTPSSGQEVWVMLGSPIPSGWVIIRSSGNMNLIKYIG